MLCQNSFQVNDDYPECTWNNSLCRKETSLFWSPIVQWETPYLRYVTTACDYTILSPAWQFSLSPLVTVSDSGRVWIYQPYKVPRGPLVNSGDYVGVSLISGEIMSCHGQSLPFLLNVGCSSSFNLPLSCVRLQPELTSILNGLTIPLHADDGICPASRDCRWQSHWICCHHRARVTSFPASKIWVFATHNEKVPSKSVTSILDCNKGDIVLPHIEFSSAHSHVCDSNQNVWWLKHQRSLSLSPIKSELLLLHKVLGHLAPSSSWPCQPLVRRLPSWPDVSHHPTHQEGGRKRNEMSAFVKAQFRDFTHHFCSVPVFRT